MRGISIAQRSLTAAAVAAAWSWCISVDGRASDRLRTVTCVTSSWSITPLDVRSARALAHELGVSETTASVLLRRGYTDAAEARTFLDAPLPGHDPRLLGDVSEACERIRAAVSAGTRICVHGDYDVDGICATAVAVLYLRELSADVRWHLPSRFEEGYGISSDTLGRLADEGVGLVLTVDCGITAVDEVADARRRGI